MFRVCSYITAPLSPSRRRLRARSRSRILKRGSEDENTGVVEQDPGFDGIISWIWEIVHDVKPQAFNPAFNACLRVGTFGKFWKRAKLSLLSKLRKSEGFLSSYSLLCLLDDVSKMLEALLVGWIERFMAACGIELADNQFDFRKGRSTDDLVRVLYRKLVST